jgi:hypothetical protein
MLWMIAQVGLDWQMAPWWIGGRLLDDAGSAGRKTKYQFHRSIEAAGPAAGDFRGRTRIKTKASGAEKSIGENRRQNLLFIRFLFV